MFILRSAAALVLAIAVATAASAQTTGTTTVSGRVLDSYQAEPLPGVTVEVVGTNIVAHTDLDGQYSVQVPAGQSYEIQFSMPSFGVQTITVDASGGNLTATDAVLGIQGVAEEVSVVAEGDNATSAVQLLERRRATVITDNIGGNEMKANADSNAASALSRVTGLSVGDNSQVFVRGLGDRYSNTTLNGNTLPSTEPERKVVSLDMFPAGLLESVSVVKTYTPDRPAEFAGGLVEIVPIRQINRQFGSLSYSIGGNGQALGQDILDHTSSSGDFWGLSNDARNLPGVFPDRRIIRGGIYTPEVGVLRSDLERFGEMLPNDWSPVEKSGRPNQGFSASYGNRWGGVGLSGSLSHSYGNTYRDEDQTYYRTSAGALTPFSTYDYSTASANGSMTALVNAGYGFATNNRVTMQFFSTDKSSW